MEVKVTDAQLLQKIGTLVIMFDIKDEQARISEAQAAESLEKVRVLEETINTLSKK